jgi:hypothetical protein
MTEQEVWNLVVGHEAVIKREIKPYLPSHRRAREFDDMYADVVLLRAHRIMRNFDPARGVLPITFLVKNCKWYAFEWALNRKYKKQVSTVPIDASLPLGIGAQNGHAHNGVDHLLEGLPEECAWVMRCLYLRGNTHREIAEHAGWELREVKEVERVARFLIEFNHAEE